MTITRTRGAVVEEEDAEASWRTSKTKNEEKKSTFFSNFSLQISPREIHKERRDEVLVGTSGGGKNRRRRRERTAATTERRTSRLARLGPIAPAEAKTDRKRRAFLSSFLRGGKSARESGEGVQRAPRRRTTRKTTNGKRRTIEEDSERKKCAA